MVLNLKKEIKFKNFSAIIDSGTSLVILPFFKYLSIVNKMMSIFNYCY